MLVMMMSGLRARQICRLCAGQLSGLKLAMLGRRTQSRMVEVRSGSGRRVCTSLLVGVSLRRQRILC